MKNIFLLPTDKPSRLILRKDNKFILSTPITQWHGKNQNIYITNDEEIKEGDWFINTKSLGIFKHYFKDGNLYKYCKKIILTTDQYLDGVQFKKK